MHAVLVASPEYAHGMPGVPQNALEAVGSGELSGRPVAVPASPPWPSGGDRARAWLGETLGVMGAVVPEEAALGSGLVKSRFGADGSLTDPEIALSLRNAWSAPAKELSRREEE